MFDVLDANIETSFLYWMVLGCEGLAPRNWSWQEVYNIIDNGKVFGFF